MVFCNWLSEKEGFAPCYDLSHGSLKSPCPNGYRLPTEAEWERAAAWSGSKHYVYGMKSDALTAFKSCNWFDVTAGNPFGFAGEPYTSPVGWFNGTNISPNGNFKTINSPSPAGCYDMSGNVKEMVLRLVRGLHGGRPNQPERSRWRNESFVSRRRLYGPSRLSHGLPQEQQSRFVRRGPGLRVARTK